MKKEWYMGEMRNTYKKSAMIGKSGLSKFPPAIIACAITGGMQGKEANPNLPITLEEQVQATYDAYNAGAVLVHIHTRNPKDTSQMSHDPETYKEINKRVREKCPDIIINNTFVGCRLYYADKVADPLWQVSAQAKPEVASLDLMKSIFGPTVFAQTYPDALNNLKVLEEHGCKPELELFDPGDLKLLNQLIEEQLIKAPYWIQAIFNGNGTYPAIEYMQILEKMIPDDSLLSVIGVGPAQTPMGVLSLLMGHHVRVGLEDNVYYDKGQLASSNAQLVERMVRIAKEIGRPLATPAQAREMMGLSAPRQYK